jgi:hypothetical protein
MEGSAVPDLPDVLDRAARCVLAFSGRRGPVLSPMAFWADGASLWMATPARSVKAAALRERPECAVHVPAPGGMGDDVVLTGHARLFGAHDPVGLALHGPMISAAMAALASRNTGTILGYVQDVRNVPQRFRPHHRVVVRIRVQSWDAVAPQQPGTGVSPALPTVVAADIRRALAGHRQVTVATQEVDGRVHTGPAVWGAGYALEPAGDLALPDGVHAAVHVGADPQRAPADVVGVTLFGALRSGRLEPVRAAWWDGFTLRSADLPPPARSSVVLPD